MDKQQRKTGFARRFNAALEKGGKATFSDGELVKLLARKGVVTSSQSVSNWRNGKHMPKLDQIEGIAQMLGVDPGELAFGKPRIGESRGAWRSGSDGDQAMAEALTLLGEQEREVLRTLIRMLGSRGSRPGRRKRARQD